MERRSRSIVRQVAPVKLMEKFVAQRISLPPVLEYIPTVKKQEKKDNKEKTIEEKQTEGYC